MRQRKLALKKETFAELGSHDLGRVGGGSGTCGTCFECMIADITQAIAIDDIGTLEGCFTHHSSLDCLTRDICR